MNVFSTFCYFDCDSSDYLNVRVPLSSYFPSLVIDSTRVYEREFRISTTVEGEEVKEVPHCRLPSYLFADECPIVDASHLEHGLLHFHQRAAFLSHFMVTEPFILCAPNSPRDPIPFHYVPTYCLEASEDNDLYDGNALYDAYVLGIPSDAKRLSDRHSQIDDVRFYAEAAFPLVSVAVDIALPIRNEKGLLSNERTPIILCRYEEPLIIDGARSSERWLLSIAGVASVSDPSLLVHYVNLGDIGNFRSNPVNVGTAIPYSRKERKELASIRKTKQVISDTLLSCTPLYRVLTDMIADFICPSLNTFESRGLHNRPNGSEQCKHRDCALCAFARLLLIQLRFRDLTSDGHVTCF